MENNDASDFSFDFTNVDTLGYDETQQLADQSAKEIKDKVIFRGFLEKSYNRVSQIEDLLGRLPENNEQIRIITQKSFNMYAILLYIIEKINVNECFICIYRIDKNSIKGLNDLLNVNESGDPHG